MHFSYKNNGSKVCKCLSCSTQSWISLHKVWTLYSIDTHFNASTTDSIWNITGREEIARNEQFLLFPQCFLLNQIIASPFVHIFDAISLSVAEMEDLKMAYQVKGSPISFIQPDLVLSMVLALIFVSETPIQHYLIIIRSVLCLCNSQQLKFKRLRFKFMNNFSHF